MTVDRTPPKEVPVAENSDPKQDKTGTQGRRRFVRGTIAAPVLLVASRSVLASTTTQQCALSPMAWISAHPQTGVQITPSHTPPCATLGLSPGYWKPNKGKTFQGPWPVNPFIETPISSKPNQSRTYPNSWDPSRWNDYRSLCYDDPNGNDAGWNRGFRSPFGSGKSISRVLIDHVDDGGKSSHVESHLCAAYLNALSVPGYALSVQEVLDMYMDPVKVFGRILSKSEIMDFLDQTWN